MIRIAVWPAPCAARVASPSRRRTTASSDGRNSCGATSLEPNWTPISTRRFAARWSWPVRPRPPTCPAGSNLCAPTDRRGRSLRFLHHLARHPPVAVEPGDHLAGGGMIDGGVARPQLRGRLVVDAAQALVVEQAVVPPQQAGEFLAQHLARGSLPSRAIGVGLALRVALHQGQRGNAEQG